MEEEDTEFEYYEDEKADGDTSEEGENAMESPSNGRSNSNYM